MDSETGLAIAELVFGVFCCFFIWTVFPKKKDITPGCLGFIVGFVIGSVTILVAPLIGGLIVGFIAAIIFYEFQEGISTYIMPVFYAVGGAFLIIMGGTALWVNKRDWVHVPLIGMWDLVIPFSHPEVYIALATTGSIANYVGTYWIKRRRKKKGDEAMRVPTLVRVERTVTINAPVEKVFSYITDPNNKAEYTPGITDVRDIAGKGMGQRFSWTDKIMGTPLKVEAEVIEYIPNERYVQRSTGDTVSTWTWAFKPETSSTHVNLVVKYTVHLRLRSRVSKQLEQQTDLVMASIKSRLEG